MQPFSRIISTAVAFPADNVDTDQILPGRFLKTISRQGLGSALFHNLRYDADGTSRPDFFLNRPSAAYSTILMTGANFGCGSSREHAPWALLDFGFKVIVARGFADIFYNNCINCGLLPAMVGVEESEILLQAADGATVMTVDLTRQTIQWDDQRIGFSISAGAKQKLLLGLDMIGTTLCDDQEIAAFEGRRAESCPWLP